MTKNMSIYEKRSSPKCYSLNNWASITNYFVDFSDILFGLKHVPLELEGAKLPSGSLAPSNSKGTIYTVPAAQGLM